MKIGIIVFSRTGHTLSVAEKLRDTLAAAGHEVRLERVTAEGGDPGKGGAVRLTGTPAVEPYDACVFASPVEGFSLAQPMKLYLKQIGSLKGKKTGFFVTRHLTPKWMGGSRSIAQMENACREKGAEIGKFGMITWKDEELRERQTTETVALLSGMF
ncbi:flavodoxin family protein [Papillibacter cinnamivorans]|uniref:Flavodoxin n=1 Tax=Papillibacter cinnamivorans DSM 12816 TaxID=1122930 RepID=A0A1W2C9Z5_9FIRM|nr:flavodoxin family protein [Papillibacter cinnamivorans]SMC81969.1 hypothetical protein SAMN02745168_2685 [Papillibacter cinnamivorans DSM 12816]